MESDASFHVDNGTLSLPRGGFKKVREVLNRHGYSFTIIDNRCKGDPKFKGKLPDYNGHRLRDYQVSAVRDFGLYQQALAGKPNAVLQLLPALNHLLVPGAGESTPAEYEQPGHVDPAVIEAIAAFATARSAKAP